MSEGYLVPELHEPRLTYYVNYLIRLEQAPLNKEAHDYREHRGLRRAIVVYPVSPRIYRLQVIKVQRYERQGKQLHVSGIVFAKSFIFVEVVEEDTHKVGSMSIVDVSVELGIRGLQKPDKHV